MTDGPIPVLNSSQFNKTDDPKKFSVTIGNPLNQTYTNIGTKGTHLNGYVGPDAILSVNSAGQVEARPPQHPGTDELCVKQSGMAVYENVFEGWPVSFLIPFDGIA